MSLIIEVKTMPQKQHRYRTLGDYVGHERLRFVQISEMNNSKYEFLLAIHELVEQALCLERGISEESITKFDMEFEGDEPGDDPAAPYHKEHVYATAIEQSLCKELGLSWTAYERFLNEYVRENMK